MCILQDVEPDHLHLRLGVVRQLPEHDLLAHVQRHEDGRTVVLVDRLPLVLLHLHHVHEIAFNMAEVELLLLQGPPGHVSVFGPAGDDQELVRREDQN